MADTIYTKLGAIQQAIKVPKDLNNSFAGFKYRSAEGILEKLKPLLDKHKVTVVLTDSVEDHANQAYVVATARLVDCADPTQTVEVQAFAREEITRPKMSEGQLTGAASSYARKYALNGLLLLDDGKDPDSQDNTKKKATEPTKSRNASMKQIELMVNKVKWGLGLNDKDQVLRFLDSVLGKPLTDVKAEEVDDSLQMIDKAIREEKVHEVTKVNTEEADIVVPVTGETVTLEDLPY